MSAGRALNSAPSYALFFESEASVLGMSINLPSCQSMHPPAPASINGALACGSVSVLFDLVWPQCVAPHLALPRHVRICQEMYGQRPEAARGVLGVGQQPDRRAKSSD